MIIDAHQHVVPPKELGNYQAGLFAARHSQHRGAHGIKPEHVAKATWKGANHAQLLDEVGTNMAFISPRPYTMMHSEKPEKIVHWYCQAVNDVIAMAVKNWPNHFRGVAGLPQCSGVSPANTFEEIDRCINELGFIGVMINPDPGEGDYASPPMGDEYWYPLYEKLERMDIPALVHPATCKNHRESYHNHFITEESIAILSLVDSPVFKLFPKLKLIISHGGGSVPYQIGRWRSQMRGPNDTENFDARLKQLYFDTALYNKESLELLFKIVGPERCLFGTERPGAGSKVDPRTGKWYDNVRPTIESIEWLGAEDRAMIFQRNAEKVFTRFKAPAESAAAA
jgi:predicted TIM-barrel fold metal-dependent hydrolase